MHAEDAAAPVLPHDGPLPESADRQVPFRALLTRPVLIAAGSYATFSLIEMAFRAVLPVFLATPIDMGGLNLDPPAIGTILSLLGISSGVIQWICFAPMHDWLGARNMFLITTFACLPVVALFPAISYVAREQGLGITVWLLVGLQMALFILASFAFGKRFWAYSNGSFLNALCLSRCELHVHKRCRAKPSLHRRNERPRADDRVPHACDRTCRCELGVFAER